MSAERKTVFPHAPGGMALPFEDAPVEIDGMKVLFDTKVALFPVELEEQPPVERRRSNGRRRRRAAHENGWNGSAR